VRLPQEPAPIVRADVSTEAIIEGWDAFLRVVTMIEQGWRWATET
jgi:hypothetical protein